MNARATLPPRRFLAGVLAALLAAAAPGRADAPGPDVPKATALFAVVFRTGPAWDPARPPHEQALFQEHSANLKRLREAGVIALGARYGDVGLIVVAAADEAAAREFFAADPSIPKGTFRMEVHRFLPFYGGCIGPPKK